jgi:hypothetical protein
MRIGELDERISAARLRGTPISRVFMSALQFEELCADFEATACAVFHLGDKPAGVPVSYLRFKGVRIDCVDDVLEVYE